MLPRLLGFTSPWLLGISGQVLCYHGYLVFMLPWLFGVLLPWLLDFMLPWLLDISGKEMVNPVKNVKCGHRYDRDGILNHIKLRKGKAK